MSAYDKRQVGNATEFSTTPEVVPYPWVMIAIPGVLLILIAFSISFIAGIIACGFCYGAMYLLMHSKQATLYRIPATFRVSNQGVEVGGRIIAKGDIHRVIVRNHVLKNAENLIVPLDNSGSTSNARAGMNWALSKLGPISYRVDVEAGGVPTALAGGLTEPAASAILSDVTRLLQFS